MRLESSPFALAALRIPGMIRQLLPLQFGAKSPRRLARLAPLITTVVTLVLYSATLLPEVSWSDSAELSLQAYQLGVTHPPGYPVHTFLGKFFILTFGKPAFATNLLSAVSVSLAAGLLSLTAFGMTDNWWASTLAGLTFAFVPIVWDVAVVTEVYGVNICLVALSLLLILSWYRKSTISRLVASAAVFGTSLGSYLANLLILPGFLLLLLRRRRGRLARVALFLSIVIVMGSTILSWSYFRSSAIPPLGTRYLPDSPRGFLVFLTGAQYQTVQIQAWRFHLDRLVEHSGIFCRSFLFFGVILGLLGLRFHWKGQRPTCVALLVIFVMDMGYFTNYAATDYYTMAIPSYYVFSLWIAQGVHSLSTQTAKPGKRLMTVIGLSPLLVGLVVIGFALGADRLGFGRPGFGPVQVLLLLSGLGLLLVGFALRRKSSQGHWISVNVGRIAAVLLSLALVVGLACTQLASRLERSRRTPVTDYVLASFEVFPEDAVVVASWDKFAPLLYFQRTQKLREDLTIVERTLGTEPRPRTYRFGTVDDWRLFVRRAAQSNPVFVDIPDESIGSPYEFDPAYHGWYQLAKGTSHP
jgi:hypothetical protein